MPGTGVSPGEMVMSETKSLLFWILYSGCLAQKWQTSSAKGQIVSHLGFFGCPWAWRAEADLLGGPCIDSDERWCWLRPHPGGSDRWKRESEEDRLWIYNLKVAPMGVSNSLQVRRIEDNCLPIGASGFLGWSLSPKAFFGGGRYKGEWLIPGPSSKGWPHLV